MLLTFFYLGLVAAMLIPLVRWCRRPRYEEWPTDNTF